MRVQARDKVQVVDSATKRSYDINNYLLIEDCQLTSEAVDQYLGSELPAELNLESNKLYNVYRPKNELEKAINGYNLQPLVDNHHFIISGEQNKDKWLGTTGQVARLENGKVLNTVRIWGEDAIKSIENIDKGGKDELSVGYYYVLVEEKGVYEGLNYDFKMTDIEVNHVALVDNARNVGSKIADSVDNIRGNKMNKTLKRLLGMLKDENPEEFKEVVKELDSDVDSNKDNDDMMKHIQGMIESVVSKALSEAVKTKEVNIDEAKDEEFEKIKEVYENCKDSDLNFSADDFKEYMMSKANAGDSAERINAVKLCESVIGKTHFTADMKPEAMLDSVLKAKKIACDGKSYEAKKSMLEVLAMQKPVSVNKIVAKDSEDYKPVFLGE